MKNKIIFYIVWLGILSLIPITIFIDTPLSLVLKSSATIANTFQRLLGLTAFTLMFFQIVIGSFMNYWTEKFGGWIFNFHITEGIIAYILIILHPVSFVFFNYFAGVGFNPFFVFVDFCVLCSTRKDLYYTLGRISFWLLNISVWAGLLRTTTPFMRVNWRKFHILNYLIFMLIGLHSIGVGTDIGTPPFSFFHGPSLVIVSLIIIFKLFNYIKDYRHRITT